jgi:cold shock CspA family protein
MEGIVRTLFADKSYGFIKTEDKDDFFFHRDDFQGHWQDLVKDFQNLSVGIIKVEFVPDYQKNKGPRAYNVRRLDWPNQA